MKASENASFLFEIDIRPGAGFLLLLILGVALLTPFPTVEAQSFQVLHNFTGGADETNSQSGLTIDRSGQLYGTTIGPSNCDVGCGTVYRLSRQGSGWILSTLYAFRGGTDGSVPVAPVTIAADSSLYGTTGTGGIQDDCCGTVYHLQPPAAFCHSVTCPWNETVVHRFLPCPNLFGPGGGVTFDQAGDIFGGAGSGGIYGQCQEGNQGFGGVYELTPSSGGWNYQAIYQFQGPPTGCNPIGKVVVDQAGNIFGSDFQCGIYGNIGAVYEVSPSGGGWTETELHSFGKGTDGASPFAGLISDSAGNLYGTTTYGGVNGSGEVFELSPTNGSYTYSVLYDNFNGGVGPACPLSMDAAGNLYGTQYRGGASNKGMIFKLTPGNGGWTFTDLHDFSGNDGSYPDGNVALDTNGNLYGVANAGGAYGYGVIWELTL